MSNEKFTQGEWRIVSNHHFCDIESPSSRIASMCASGFGATAKNYADAHLIAAAPDMYRALRNIAGRATSLVPDESGIYKSYLTQAEVEAIHAALAKADGE